MAWLHDREYLVESGHLGFFSTRLRFIASYEEIDLSTGIDAR